RIPSAIVGDHALFPVATTGGEIKPLLLDLTQQYGLTLLTIALTAHLNHPPATNGRWTAPDGYDAAGWTGVLYAWSINHQLTRQPAVPPSWQSWRSDGIAGQ